jgi:hypothetical protein
MIHSSSTYTCLLSGRVPGEALQLRGYMGNEQRATPNPWFRAYIFL